MIPKTRFTLLAIAIGALIGGAVYAADVAYKDRVGSGVQKPTQALVDQFGKRDPRNLAAPFVELECVQNELLPQANWVLEKVPVWIVPGVRVRPFWNLVETTDAAGAKSITEVAIDGFCEVTVPDGSQAPPPLVVKGNAAEVGRRLALAAGADYVSIAFDAR